MLRTNPMPHLKTFARLHVAGPGDLPTLSALDASLKRSDDPARSEQNSSLLCSRQPERRTGIFAGMSAYLVGRLVEHPMVSAFTSTELTALGGADRLEGVMLTNRTAVP